MKKTTMNAFAKLGLLAFAFFLAANANSATVTWNFENQSPVGPVFTDTVSGAMITLSAYYATSATSNWTTATFTNQGDLGVGMTSSGESSTSPQHAIDSIGAGGFNTDIVVIDAGAGKAIDWTQLMIGWGVDNTANNGTGGTGGQADIKLWAGNTLNISSATLNNTLNLGNASTNLLSNVLVSAPGNPHPADITLSPSRYLVMAGDVNDAFKLKSLTGVTGYKVPEPASIALLALGLLGLGFTRRKNTG